MSENKVNTHTPGPWQWYHGGNHKALVRGGHSRVIMQRNSDGDILWADARLLAAAPDLLAALVGIMDQACVNGCAEFESADGEQHCVEHTEACEAARAAIAKATQD